MVKTNSESVKNQSLHSVTAPLMTPYKCYDEQIILGDEFENNILSL